MEARKKRQGSRSRSRDPEGISLDMKLLKSLNKAFKRFDSKWEKIEDRFVISIDDLDMALDHNVMESLKYINIRLPDYIDIKNSDIGSEYILDYKRYLEDQEENKHFYQAVEKIKGKLLFSLNNSFSKFNRYWEGLDPNIVMICLPSKVSDIEVEKLIQKIDPLLVEFYDFDEVDEYYYDPNDDICYYINVTKYSNALINQDIFNFLEAEIPLRGFVLRKIFDGLFDY